MRNPKPSLSRTGAIPALVVAGALLAGNGILFAAQTKPAPPAKPAQLVNRSAPAARPAAPARPAARPAAPPARPAAQPTRPTAQPTTRTEPGGKPATRTEPKTPTKTESRTEPKTESRTETKTESRTEPKTESRTESKTGPGSGAKPTAAAGGGHAAPVADPRTGKANPPPGTTTSRRADGGSTLKTPDGRVMQTNSKGQLTSVRTPSGIEAHYRNGQLTTMHKVGPDGSVTDLHSTPGGGHTIRTVTPDPSAPRDGKVHTLRTVSDGHRGYRERELFRRPGYRERTYFANGRTYAVIYHDRDFGRYGAYPVYVPAYTYAPGYYGWIGTPWGASVAFGWGPLAVYGGYFAPPATYDSPNAWVADYVINQNLQADAATQQDAQADGTQPAADPQADVQPQPIPQPVRQQYVEQVQSTVQADQAAASGQPVAEDVPGALSPKHKLFQSYSDTEATDVNGGECSLTGGDFVQREEDTPDSSKMVAVTVVAIAKPSSTHCAMNARVRLPVDTLQDWYNSYAEHEAAGLQAMASQAGKNGIPAAPDAGRTANPSGQATPDDSGAMASAIQQQQNGANAMQSEVAGGGQ